MAFKLFIAVIGLIGAYIIFDTGQILLVKHAVNKAEESYTLGNKNADLKVVEFLDYSCVHCRDLHPILIRTLERDGKVLYIPRPIASVQNEDGTDAAKLAYAAGWQGKFIEAHMVLIENFRPIDEAYIKTFSEQLSLDTQKLLADIKDPEIDKILQKNLTSLGRLGARTVPALLIDNQMMLLVTDEQPTSDELLSLFNQARAL